MGKTSEDSLHFPNKIPNKQRRGKRIAGLGAFLGCEWIENGEGDRRAVSSKPTNLRLRHLEHVNNSLIETHFFKNRVVYFQRKH